MRVLRTLAPVVCVVAVLVTRTAPFAAFAAAAERTLHRSLGEEHIICRLYLDPHDKGTRVVPQRRASLARTGAAESNAVLSNITANYTGFTGANGAAAQAAFQAAIDIWKTQVASTVPIVVDAEFLDICAAHGLVPNCGLLGSAGSAAIRDAPETPAPATWFPFPLVNKIAAIDVGAKYYGVGASNIGAQFDSVRNDWYFGTDGNVPSGKVDFVSVVLHELGHGLGFFGAASVSSGLGTVGSNGFPYIYDRSVVDQAGTSVVTGYVNGSAALGSLLTSGGTSGSQSTGTFWSGTNGISANGGARPKLYAPATFLPGSSHSHLDEDKFPAGNINSLMTPSIGFREAIHTPGPITLGMFADMGWGSNSGGSCSYGLDRSSATVAAAGGSVSVTLSTGVSCPWTASTAAGFITIAPAANGTGSQVFTLTVAAHSGVSGRIATVTIGGVNFQVNQNGSGPTMALDKTSLIFSAVNNGVAFTAQTPAQIVRMVQSGAGSVTWTATSNRPWLRVAKGGDAPAGSTSGTGSATFTITTVFVNGLDPTQTGTITLAFNGAGNFAGPITVTLNSIAGVRGADPFGAFDTPADQSTGIAGSLPVTGWALDDVGVVSVKIWRVGLPEEGGRPMFIGDAAIVDGARPDVAALYPNLPQNTRAGWGYLMLTNFLPNLGNGTFTIYAVATDAEGNTVNLGTKTITCTNSTSFAPFGAIDTPAQGGTADGIFANYGWVLSRGAGNFANGAQGGTVRVVIDGAPIASVPGEWTSRVDLDQLFPPAEYPGISKAFAVAGINTTTLTNGVHTIAWGVTGTNGQSAGIGSRYFTVSNGSGLTLAPDDGAAKTPAVVSSPAVLEMPRAAALRGAGSPVSLAAEVAAAPADLRSISARRGYDESTPLRRYRPSNGLVTVQSEELDRLELRLGSGPGLTGYVRSGNALTPLPIGSTLNGASGVFTWQPGAGFVGAYDLAFVRWNGGRAASRHDVRVVLNQKGSNRVGPQVVIDLPATNPGEVKASSFVVAGWAADLDSTIDGGVDTVHVWAYPVAANGAWERPIFIGPAAFGGSRPDVAAVYGERFGKSGYGIEVTGLAPGTYDVAVFAYSTVADGFVPAKTVRVRVR